MNKYMEDTVQSEVQALQVAVAEMHLRMVVISCFNKVILLNVITKGTRLPLQSQSQSTLIQTYCIYCCTN